MSRPWNFCAGPAALPQPVLEQAASEMLDWHGTGMSFMEMSHRSPEVVATVEEAEACLRRLLQISDDYAVLSDPLHASNAPKAGAAAAPGQAHGGHDQPLGGVVGRAGEQR